jgi:hypothetical protein
MAGRPMIGIILTLIAVLLVICLAFYYADHRSRGGPNADSFFYIKPKGFRKSADGADQ